MINDTTFWVLVLALAILLTFAFLFFVFWLGWQVSKGSYGASPYTGTPLRYASDLSFFVKEQVAHYLLNLHQYDNRGFKFNRASFCRETGRIFPNSVNFLGVIHVDWTFLNKHYPGHYVSWGSLNKDQQQAVRDSHDSLEGFQTEYSSPAPAPRAIAPEYVYTKPGPLYVDIGTRILLGWKEIPETGVEVLIVQKPVR